MKKIIDIKLARDLRANFSAQIVHLQCMTNELCVLTPSKIHSIQTTHLTN